MVFIVKYALGSRKEVVEQEIPYCFGSGVRKSSNVKTVLVSSTPWWDAGGVLELL